MTRAARRYLSSRPLAVCLLAAAAALCASRCSRSETSVTRGASGADLAAIGRIHKEYVAAHNASDAERLMGLWADDAVLMPMDEPSLTGKEAIREHYQDFFDQNPSQISLSPLETRVAGDWAFERIQMTVTFADGEGEQERYADVKYLWILQRQSDGSWKIARAIYNLDGGIDDEENLSA
jgi:uncharacterized protein (TIGR02246 family)